MSGRCRFSEVRCFSRSKDIIEPLLKAQWYVRCDEMARKAMAAVESGELKLIPDYHVATWNRWLQGSRCVKLIGASC